MTQPAIGGEGDEKLSQQMPPPEAWLESRHSDAGFRGGWQWISGFTLCGRSELVGKKRFSFRCIRHTVFITSRVGGQLGRRSQECGEMGRRSMVDFRWMICYWRFGCACSGKSMLCAKTSSHRPLRKANTSVKIPRPVTCLPSFIRTTAFCVPLRTAISP